MMMMQSGEEGGEEKEVLVALLRQAVTECIGGGLIGFIISKGTCASIYEWMTEAMHASFMWL